MKKEKGRSPEEVRTNNLMVVYSSPRCHNLPPEGGERDIQLCIDVFISDSTSASESEMFPFLFQFILKADSHSKSMHYID